MATTENTITKSKASEKLTAVHSLLLGADKLLAGIEIADDSQGDFWAARELLKMGMDQIVETGSSLSEMQQPNEVTA